jgi:uncharacterized protein YkvS
VFKWEMPAEFKAVTSVEDEKKAFDLKRKKSMKLRKVGEWEEMKDADSGALYYYNHRTGATQWEMPAEFNDYVSESEPEITSTANATVLSDSDLSTAASEIIGLVGMKRTKSMRLRKVGDWEELKEEATGKVFFYNHNTAVSQWDPPAGFDANAAVPVIDKFTLSDSEDPSSSSASENEAGIKRTKSMRLRKVGDWEELKEEATGKVFFYNHKTAVSQWDTPAEFNESAAFELKRKHSMKLERIGDWEQFKDPANGDEIFYYNHVTGASVWDPPAGLGFDHPSSTGKGQSAAALIAQQYSTDMSILSGGDSTDASEINTLDESYSALGI